MSDAPSLERAADFVWRNARLLERTLFARRFLGGPADAVLAALGAYRNPDGGFGHALEPDVRAPDSMPLHAEIALRSLELAHLRQAELALDLCDWLAGLAEPDGRVPMVTAQVREYPRAAHWEADFGPDSPNPTAVLAGLLVAQGIEHPWLERASEWTWRRLERPLDDAHEIAAALLFLEHAPERERAAALAPAVVRQADGLGFYLATPGATTYGLTPLQLCPAPGSIARPAFDDALLEAHLDDLAARQQPDGGWPIYFEPPGPAAVFEWRARRTLEALDTLDAWGRL